MIYPRTNEILSMWQAEFENGSYLTLPVLEANINSYSSGIRRTVAQSDELTAALSACKRLSLDALNAYHEDGQRDAAFKAVLASLTKLREACDKAGPSDESKVLGA